MIGAPYSIRQGGEGVHQRTRARAGARAMTVTTSNPPTNKLPTINLPNHDATQCIEFVIVATFVGNLREFGFS